MSNREARSLNAPAKGGTLKKSTGKLSLRSKKGPRESTQETDLPVVPAHTEGTLVKAAIGTSFELKGIWDRVDVGLELPSNRGNAVRAFDEAFKQVEEILKDKMTEIDEVKHRI